MSERYLTHWNYYWSIRIIAAHFNESGSYLVGKYVYSSTMCRAWSISSLSLCQIIPNISMCVAGPQEHGPYTSVMVKLATWSSYNVQFIHRHFKSNKNLHSLRGLTVSMVGKIRIINR